jgi:L-ascorbate metabolism protein UlaG (beta-lactamase superfamily)
MRLNPYVIDPCKFECVDAVCVTHHHQDHMDFYRIAAALQATNCKFIAPPEAARWMMKDMGVPENPMILAKVGESVQIENMKIDLAPNFDTIATKIGFETPTPFDKSRSALSSIPKRATTPFEVIPFTTTATA